MDQIVIFSVVLEVLLGEEIYFFYGVATNLQAAQDRALANMHEDEYLKCVKYRLVATHYGIL
ncbi:MAG: hypothetical protein WC648_04645 [Candidatus Paceibacterota bacterium]|jgi:hypothetical protein